MDASKPSDTIAATEAATAYARTRDITLLRIFFIRDLFHLIVGVHARAVNDEYCNLDFSFCREELRESLAISRQNKTLECLTQFGRSC